MPYCVENISCTRLITPKEVSVICTEGQLTTMYLNNPSTELQGSKERQTIQRPSTTVKGQPIRLQLSAINSRPVLLLKIERLIYSLVLKARSHISGRKKRGFECLENEIPIVISSPIP